MADSTTYRETFLRIFKVFKQKRDILWADVKILKFFNPTKLYELIIKEYVFICSFCCVFFLSKHNRPIFIPMFII